MTGWAEPACTSTISSDGGHTLAVTGTDPSIWVHVAVVAGALVFVGILALLVHHRRTRVLAGVAAAAFAVAVFLVPTPPAEAAPSPTASVVPCALIKVDDVTSQTVSALAPGESAAGLSYRVTNVTAFPIDVLVSTAVASDPGAIAGQLSTTITTDAPVVVASDAAPLSGMPVSKTVHLDPGGTVTTSYTHTLEDTAGNTAQGHVTLYNSTVVAVQAPR